MLELEEHCKVEIAWRINYIYGEDNDGTISEEYISLDDEVLIWQKHNKMETSWTAAWVLR